MGLWFWSVILVFVTVAAHVTGIICIALIVRQFWTEELRPDLSFFDSIPGAVVIVTGIALALAALHGIEALIWAIAYVQLAVLPSMHDGILYSLSFMSTSGAPGLGVRGDGLIMGAVEACDGMLLFGVSTAFLFSVMVGLWKRVYKSR
jgi:hypothetical protein